MDTELYSSDISSNTTTETRQVYISLDNLKLYDKFLRSIMSAEDAKALKTVTLSADNRKLLFYTKSQPVGETSPAFEIEIPEPSLDGVMAKVTTATEGNIGIFNGAGTIVDSGASLDDFVTIESLATEVAKQIAMSSVLKKEIVTELPTISAAKENIIYMINDPSVTEGDAYEEWTLIGGQLVQIGTTSISLEGYYTKVETDNAIDSAKQAAISNAVSQATTVAEEKAGQALIDANSYADAKHSEALGAVDALKSVVDGHTTSIGSINTLLSAQGTRITNLETKMNDMEFATDADIQAIFAK